MAGLTKCRQGSSSPGTSTERGPDSSDSGTSHCFSLASRDRKRGKTSKRKQSQLLFQTVFVKLINKIQTVECNLTSQYGNRVVPEAGLNDMVAIEDVDEDVDEVWCPSESGLAVSGADEPHKTPLNPWQLSFPLL